MTVLKYSKHSLFCNMTINNSREKAIELAIEKCELL
jgi:hypothetical protein